MGSEVQPVALGAVQPVTSIASTKPLGKVALVSLGCAKNLVDSEIIVGQLIADGYAVDTDLESCDTVIINTCGFIDEAKQESIDAILDASERKEQGQIQRLLVAGCMANRYGQELQSEISGIDGFIGLDDLQRSSQLISLGRSAPPQQVASHLLFDHRAPRVLSTVGHAYLKVAEGCNNPCTFCAIPVWRGKFRSRSIESLVLEAQQLQTQGATELCLVAQDTTRYGEDLGLGRGGLLKLVQSLLAETDIPWIRFLYAYPTTLDLDLVRLMAEEQRLCTYLDMPLQHSEREILRAMQRGGSADSYLRLLAEARRIAPEIRLRTTMLVGFPGETDEHFESLCDFVEEVEFDYLGAFAYSPEGDTPSAELADRPPLEVAEERRAALLEVQSAIVKRKKQADVGRTLQVLVEGVCDETEHLLQGRHQGMAPEVDGRVLINDGPHDQPNWSPASVAAGSLHRVEITDAFENDWVGRLLASQQ